jgi:hypothetical protein
VYPGLFTLELGENADSPAHETYQAWAYPRPQ